MLPTFFINFMAWLKSESKKKKTPTAHPIQRKSNEFFWGKRKTVESPQQKKEFPDSHKTRRPKFEKKNLSSKPLQVGLVFLLISSTWEKHPQNMITWSHEEP